MPNSVSKSKIATKIKKLRKQKGLLQDPIPKLADVSYNTAKESASGGITKLSIYTLQRSAKALNSSLNI